MTNRIVVTGTDHGRACIVHDGAPHGAHRYAEVPGFETVVAWATPSAAPLEMQPTEGIASILPEPGGSRLLLVTFPPDAVMAAPDFDPMAAVAEYARHLPGLAERFEPDAPGMHCTNTLDYAIVLEGEIVLDLDGGQERTLRAGDIVVQRATRHAWRNRSTVPARLAFVMFGL